MKTVNFIEACRSGARFKYVGAYEEDFFQYSEQAGKLYTYAANGEEIYITSLKSFLFEEFEIIEVPILLTKSQVEQAMSDSYVYNELDHSAFLERLGFYNGQ